MKLVQRVSTVVTEDMPVDPEARDLQVAHRLPSALLGPTKHSRMIFGQHVVLLLYTSTHNHELFGSSLCRDCNCMWAMTE